MYLTSEALTEAASKESAMASRSRAFDAQQGVNHPAAIGDGLVIQEHGGFHAISVVGSDGGKGSGGV